MVDTVKSNWQAIGVGFAILSFLLTAVWGTSRIVSSTDQQRIFMERSMSRLETIVSNQGISIQENQKDIVRLEKQDEAQCQRIGQLERRVN